MLFLSTIWRRDWLLRTFTSHIEGFSLKVRNMIQRIQSLFLFLAALAAGGLFILPIAASQQSIPDSPLLDDGAFTVTDSSGLLALFGLSAIFALIALAAYSDRKRQMLLVRMGIGADLFGLGAIAFFGLTDQAVAAGLPAMLSAGIALPFVYAILMVLAFRAISKDDKLVRSMNRLR